MRICEKHREKATDTLVSRKTGTEYDLCSICETELAEILHGKSDKGEEDGRRRVPGRPKKITG